MLDLYKWTFGHTQLKPDIYKFLDRTKKARLKGRNQIVRSLKRGEGHIPVGGGRNVWARWVPELNGNQAKLLSLLQESAAGPL